MLTILTLFVLMNSGNGDVITLTSSAMNNMVCPNENVAYFCRATGSKSALIWLLDNAIIHIFQQDSGDKALLDKVSNSFSAFIPNSSLADVYVSELVFLELPQRKSFLVECSFGGRVNGTESTVVERTDPPIIDPCITVNTECVNISWTHDSRFNKVYHVMLNSTNIMNVIDTTVVIKLPSCNATYILLIIAVDICGYETVASSTIICDGGAEPTPMVIIRNDTIVQPMHEEAIFEFSQGNLVLLILVLVGVIISLILLLYLFCKECDCCQARCCRDSRKNNGEKGVEPLGAGELSQLPGSDGQDEAKAKEFDILLQKMVMEVGGVKYQLVPHEISK